MSPQTRGVVLTSLFLFPLLCLPLAAGDFDDEPFSLRLPLSLDRVSSFSDTIGRSASVAHPLGSSVNPASFDFLREAPFDFTVIGTLTSNTALFDSDTVVTGFSTDWAYRFPQAGTLSFNYIRTDSHDALSRQGNEVVLRSNEYVLSYAQRLDPSLSLGCSVKLIDGALDVEDSFMSFPRQTDSTSLGVDFKAGALKALDEHWSVGLVAGVGRTCSDLEGVISFPPPPFAFGPVPFDETDRTDTVNVRTGIGWRPVQAVGLYADAQYVHVESDLGKLDVGRFLYGIEAYPHPAVAIRLGGTYDTEQHATFSAGVGFYGIKNVPIEFAYSYNAFPEVNHEFGRAHLVSASVVLVF